MENKRLIMVGQDAWFVRTAEVLKKNFEVELLRNYKMLQDKYIPKEIQDAVILAQPYPAISFEVFAQAQLAVHVLQPCNYPDYAMRYSIEHMLNDGKELSCVTVTTILNETIMSVDKEPFRFPEVHHMDARYHETLLTVAGAFGTLLTKIRKTGFIKSERNEELPAGWEYTKEELEMLRREDIHNG